MDALGLRRMDIYSYGLAFWRIMCNGEIPYSKLFWDSTHANITSERQSTEAKSLNKADFIALKQKGNTLLRLAIATTKNRPKTDIDFEKAQTVLNITLCFEPTLRATCFDEIVHTLRPYGYKASSLLYASIFSTSLGLCQLTLQNSPIRALEGRRFWYHRLKSEKCSNLSRSSKLIRLPVSIVSTLSIPYSNYTSKFSLSCLR